LACRAPMMDKFIIHSHICQNLNRESAGSSSRAQLGERPRRPSTGTPLQRICEPGGRLQRSSSVGQGEFELTQVNEVPGEVPGQDVITRGSERSGDPGATIETLIIASNVDLPGVRPGRGLSSRSDHHRPSIATTIRKERWENADRSARSVHCARREGDFGWGPQRRGNGACQCGLEEERQRPAGCHAKRSTAHGDGRGPETCPWQTTE
jgi:hypothetical protein